MLESAKKNIIEALEKSLGIVSTACNAVGLPRSTFYLWLKEDEEFKAAVEDVQEYTCDVVEGHLLDLIKNKDTSATIFYAKTKMKKRGYVERQELVGADGKDLYSDKSDSELLATMNALMQKLNGSQANNSGDTSSAGATAA